MTQACSEARLCVFHRDGVVMEAAHQPVINGYFIAGSLIGPGGFKLIKEIVQVSALV